MAVTCCSCPTILLTGLLALWLQAKGRRGKISHTLNLVQNAVIDLFPESAVRSSGFETKSTASATPGPAPSPIPTPTSGPADSNAEGEGVVLHLEAAGSQQEASASGAGIGEGSGLSNGMPAPGDRADEAGRPGAAPEPAAIVSPHSHQAAADCDDFLENSDDLPDYESD